MLSIALPTLLSHGSASRLRSGLGSLGGASAATTSTSAPRSTRPLGLLLGSHIPDSIDIWGSHNGASGATDAMSAGRATSSWRPRRRPWASCETRSPQVGIGGGSGPGPTRTHIPLPGRGCRRWLKDSAQASCSRVHSETGAAALAEAASSAMRPMTVASRKGGVRASLAGGTFLEEYPTDPPSFVLNGGIFALWGAYDVWIALGEARARHVLADMTDTLEASLGRWDLGYWSRYDLYLHRMIAVASSFYHYLHIHQLRALEMIAPGKAFGLMADRFASYAASRTCRTHALARKAVFRLVVPKT